MFASMADEMADETADQVYKWTIRALYTVLIGGEIVWLFGKWRDSVEGQVTLARWRARFARIKDCEGCARRRERLRQMVAHPIIFDAEVVVDAVAREGDGAAAAGQE